MKRYIAFFSIFSALSLISACTSSSDLAAVEDEQEEQSTVTSSESKTASSSQGSTKQDSVFVKDSTKVKKDTIVDKVYVSTNTEKVSSPYYSSATTFCWNEGCEANISSSSAAKSSPSTESSSSQGGVTIEIPSDEPPTLSDDHTTLTDNRNGKTYGLKEVGGKLWMTQDLDYETSNSECFNNDDSNCETYGRLYNYIVATRACPQGWRLPSRAEAQAAIDDSSYTWSYSGRCKDGSCDFTEQMGFHWTSAEPQSGDKNFESNKGDSFAVIIVEKHPDYDKEDPVKKFFQVDSKSKFFSVRCVQE